MAVEVAELAFSSAPDMVPLGEWRALFHDSPLAIAYVSRDLHLLRLNGAFAVLCGRMAGELLGRHCYEVLGEAEPKPCPGCRVREALRTGEAREFERPFGRAILREAASPVGECPGQLGTHRQGWSGVSDSSAGAVLMIADVTAQHELRQQLNASQRLASVGTMTSSVAHELRNPLTSILGFAQLLQRRSDLPEDARAQVQRIWGESRRCDHIVSHLLKFTRRRDGAKAPVDVNRVIAESLDLLRHPLACGRVRVHQKLHPEPLEVIGHFCELQQVVQNIVVNALDAIREARERPSPRPGRSDPAEAAGNLTLRTLREDSWVLVELENDGPEIAEPHKLFQPFYTTKEAGKGTGLGLSVSNAIVRDHGGRIEAANVEHGVLFRIALPGADAPRPLTGSARPELAEGASAPAPEPESLSSPWR